MKLRIVSAVLWFWAGWAVFAAFATLLGVNTLAGPFVGLAWGALVLMDPKDLIWHRPASSSASPVTA
jgi:hypothetical protein